MRGRAALGAAAWLLASLLAVPTQADEALEQDAALPGLEVLRIAWAPYFPRDGMAVSFEAPFEARALDPSSVNAAFEVDGQPLGPFAGVEVASPRAGAALSVPWTATQGLHQVRVLLQAPGAAAELRRTVEVLGPAGADLVVRDIMVTGPPSATFAAAVSNVGLADAGPFSVAFVLDGSRELGERRVPGLDAGARTVVESVPWPWEPGFHRITVRLDPSGEVVEESEDNNVRIHTVGGEGAPVPALEAAPVLLGLAAVALALGRRRA